MVLWLDLYLIRFHFKRPLQPSTLCYHICVHTPIQHVKKKRCACFIDWCSTVVSLLSKWSRIFLPVELQHRVTSSDIQVCVGGGGAIQSPRMHNHPLPTNHCPFVTSAWHDLGRGLSAIQLETPVAPTASKRPRQHFPSSSHLVDTSLMRRVWFPSYLLCPLCCLFFSVLGGQRSSEVHFKSGAVQVDAFRCPPHKPTRPQCSHTEAELLNGAAAREIKTHLHYEEKNWHISSKTPVLTREQGVQIKDRVCQVWG